MKTAISLPDELYEAAERTAQDLGIPRSQLYAKALEQFLAVHEDGNLTEKLNRVYPDHNPEKPVPFLEAGIDSLRNLTKNDSW